jgi:hypothetical protein
MMAEKDGWRVLSDDPVMGIREMFFYDPTTDTSYIKTQHYRLEAVIDKARAERNASTNKRWGDLAKVGTVPLNIWQDQLAEATKQKDSKYIRRWLTEHDKFRTRDGRL